MGLRPTLLIAIACLLLWPGVAAFAGKAGCLHCHKAHYLEQGACSECHRGDARSDRLAIAHRDLIPAKYSWFTIAGSQPLQRGGKLLEGFACRRCHTTGGKGNRLASNLDRLPTPTIPEKIFQAIKTPALFMPDFHCDDRQMTDLVNAILAGEQKAERTQGETPQVVHFAEVERRTGNIFEQQCGPCHRVLTGAFGALGKGAIGPNLSGLFTEFYPANLKGNSRWTADILNKWLENPKKIRVNSQMRPIPLKKEEFDRLLVIFKVSEKN